MDDSVLDKAKLRLEAIEREASDLRSFIRMYVKLSGAQTQALSSVNVARHGEAVRFAGGGDGYSTKEHIVETAREVLMQVHPRPLVIGDLYTALVDRGVKINGQNPKGNLSAKLAPPDDIVYVKDEGWYYRPQKDEPTDQKLRGDRSVGSVFSNQAKGREAVPGGGP